MSAVRPSDVDPVDPVAPALPHPVLMNQRWLDLAYVHWAVDPGSVDALMPPGVVADVHDGSTYVGLVPFRMVGAGFGNGPAVPYLGSFCETNVRLYSVDGRGRRGVVFRSLDAERLAVVLGARAVLGLPYRWARMTYARSGDVHHYATYGRGGGPSGRLALRVGSPRERTSLDDFVSARWGLHVARWGRTWFVPNQHEPWPLRDAEVLHLDDGLVAAAGLPGVSGRPPDHVAFSSGVRTRFGRPHALARSPA